jgi:hypothetical protein
VDVLCPGELQEMPWAVLLIAVKLHDRAGDWCCCCCFWVLVRDLSKFFGAISVAGFLLSCVGEFDIVVGVAGVSRLWSYSIGWSWA